MDTEYELRAISTEYKSYFPELLLVIRPELSLTTNESSNPSHILLTTKEGRKLKITVAIGGWSVIGQTEYFPTFEALMNTESPQFSQTFANSLTSKLNALASLQ